MRAIQSLFVLVLINCTPVKIITAQTIVAIPDIQGAGHISPYDSLAVETTGVVTVIASNGFYLQDPVGDGNDATSDAVFVKTDPAAVAVGDSIRLTAKVVEFQPTNSRNLTVTELVSANISTISRGNTLPAPIVIGIGGRPQPTSIIEDDNFGSFDPATDGIDYYESMEGMLLKLPAVQAVAKPNNQSGKIWAVPNGGAAATGMNAEGGITTSPGDFNPEMVQLVDKLLGEPLPDAQKGDGLGDAIGVMGYDSGFYELNVIQPLVHTPNDLTPPRSSLRGTLNRLTVASYNVRNLDPFDDAAKYSALGSQIVNNLNSPDILGLQEIQDSDGPGGDVRLDADETYTALIAAISAAGGPTYEFAEIPPPIGNIDGGQRTGNIRVGYLYNPERVDLVSGSLIRHGDGESAFANSRKPLEATFEFNGQQVTIINNHFRSKGGSSGLYENIQPPTNGGVEQREDQAAFVANLVEQKLTIDSDAKIIVLGDLNDFYFFSPLAKLTGGTTPPLKDLYETVPLEERYSSEFRGNSQTLDYILVTDALFNKVMFDPVNLNSGLFNSFTISDHDPVLASLLLPVPEPTTLSLALAAICLALKRRRYQLAMRHLIRPVTSGDLILQEP